MPTLKNYNQFGGVHWETGSIHHALAYQGVVAPHTGKPISEALLMGISGGAVMGYFSFAYEGYPPHVAILTRNTFDPWDTLLARLGIVQEVRQTSNAKKAEANLVDTLENGAVPLVWADVCSMPYNDLYSIEGYWHMYPHIVYSYEPEQNVVRLADRSRAPLTITVQQLATARGRVKKSDYRIVTLDLPGMDKLASAVNLGICDCIKLYTENPPKGSKDNFGFAAYQRWIEVLTKPKARLSWEKEFPLGAKFYAGLTSTYQQIMIDGKHGNAERVLFADFLEEAALLLKRPALNEIAVQFRAAGKAWDELAVALLPDSIPLFQETRQRLWSRFHNFVTHGHNPEEQAADTARLKAIKKEVEENFPITQAEMESMRVTIADHVRKIHDIELAAVNALQKAMS